LKPPDERVAVSPGARELFERIDWSSTPLGPVQQWSQRLQTMVEIVLANRFPMIVLWGPGQLQAVYQKAAQCSSHTASPAVGWW
jgi:hypothetical protein